MTSSETTSNEMTSEQTTSSDAGQRAHLLPPSARPSGTGATLNPFVVVEGASDFIDFVVEVFGGTEIAEARSPMPDGRLIHAEIELGDANLLIVDRLDGWPAAPGLLQIWVDDVAATLDDAAARGARIVTAALAFFGQTTMGRMVDPWGNLWWLYNPAPGQDDPLAPWEGGDNTVFETIDAEMRARAAG